LNQIVKKTFGVLNPGERKKSALLIAADIAMSTADILFLALLLFIIHFYTQSPSNNKYPFLPGWLFDQHSLLLISIFFLLFSIKNAMGFLVYREQCRFLCEVASRISRNKLMRYLEGSYEDYIRVDSAVNIRKISHQPIEFCQHILGGIQQIIAQAVLILLSIVAVVIFNANLFLLLFLLLLPPVIAVFYQIKRRLRSVRTNAQTSIQKSLQHLQEALSGFVESNIYHRNEFFLRRYISRQREFNKYLSDLLIVQGIPNRMIEIFALLGLVILIAINKWAGYTDSTAIITVGAFMAAAYKIIPGVVKILNISGQMNSYSTTLEEMTAGEAVQQEQRNRQAAPNILSVSFNGVGFSYDTQPVLDDLSFRIERSDFLGISGHSGKGKTTILNLLMGFLEPLGGEILFNGISANDRIRQQYWQHISYIKQQPFLIHDTILGNILLDDQGFEQKKMDKILQLTGLTELIESFPEKMNYVIAENGKNISGGQRQRIAIARCLYKEADLIILDEPFSELDESSETVLLRHFEDLAKKGKIVILITHNKKSLSRCTKIVSLDEIYA
jgi:ABC-type multidrug transport system fused ATPase/permease subunit